MASGARASSIYGDITHHVAGDSLVLSFDLEFQHDLPDTLRLLSLESDTWYSLRKPTGEAALIDTVVVPGHPGAPLRWAGIVGLNHRLVGRLAWALDGRPVPSVIRVLGWSGPLSANRVPRWRGSRVIHPRTLALRVIPFLAFGGYSAELPGTPQRDGMLGGFSGAVDLLYGSERIFLETDVRLNFSNDKPFNFSESALGGWRHHFGSPSARWRPALELAGGYVSLTNQRGDDRFNDSEFGGRVGVALVGPHLSGSYAYGTALGGYHKISLDAWIDSAGLQRHGTRYEYLGGDGFHTVRVAYVAEGLSGIQFDDLMRTDHRAWPLKAVSMLGLLPLLPLAGVIAIIGPGV